MLSLILSHRDHINISEEFALLTSEYSIGTKMIGVSAVWKGFIMMMMTMMRWPVAYGEKKVPIASLNLFLYSPSGDTDLEGCETLRSGTSLRVGHRGWDFRMNHCISILSVPCSLTAGAVLPALVCAVTIGCHSIDGNKSQSSLLFIPWWGVLSQQTGNQLIHLLNHSFSYFMNI